MDKWTEFTANKKANNFPIFNPNINRYKHVFTLVRGAAQAFITLRSGVQISFSLQKIKSGVFTPLFYLGSPQ
jgi:L-lysine 2,3-aminomutase